MGMTGFTVRWRSTGHRLNADTDILRFEIADINRIVGKAAREAPLYRSVQDRQGHPDDWQVLVISCFAVTQEWPPERLAEGTSFSNFRLAPANRLAEAGYELWPTEVFIDGTGDPRNEVHYDLVVAAGPGLIPTELLDGDRGQRRAARAALVPVFERAIALLGEPRELPNPPDEWVAVE